MPPYQNTGGQAGPPLGGYIDWNNLQNVPYVPQQQNAWTLGNGSINPEPGSWVPESKVFTDKEGRLYNIKNGELVEIPPEDINLEN